MHRCALQQRPQFGMSDRACGESAHGRGEWWVVFVADDLGAWLVGLLADAGRKKLTTMVPGSDQERALRSAGMAAVRLTAEKLRPDNDEQAEDVTLVISQVFSEPVSDAPLAGQATLEVLRAGIAWQLARLGDPSLTVTGMFCCSSRQEASA